MAHESHQNHLDDLAHGQKVARNSMYLIIGLTLIKAFGGYVTNAVSLLGDAASSFADTITMIAIYIGLTLSLRPPDKRFRYGYHRIETFISLVIASLTTYLGYRLLRESIERLGNPETVTHMAAVGIVAAVISIGASVFAYLYQNRTALKINSQALLASARDKRNDAFITGGVLLGLVTNTLGIPVVEKIVGFGLALMVLFVGLKTIKESLLYLFDYWDDPEITNHIKKIIKESKLVTEIKKIRLRHAGTYIFGEAFLEINPFADMIDLRDEIHVLEKKIDEEIPHLGDFVLYVDPPKPEKMRVAIPIIEDNGLKSHIPHHYKDPFRFIMVDIENRKISGYQVFEETFLLSESAKIAAYLKLKHVNILISSHVETILYYSLRLSKIRVYPQFTNVHDVEHTVKLLLLEL